MSKTRILIPFQNKLILNGCKCLAVFKCNALTTVLKIMFFVYSLSIKSLKTLPLMLHLILKIACFCMVCGCQVAIKIISRMQERATPLSLCNSSMSCLAMVFYHRLLPHVCLQWIALVYEDTHSICSMVNYSNNTSNLTVSQRSNLVIWFLVYLRFHE